MKIIRPAQESEVIAAFLRAEFYQPEFDRDRSDFEQLVEHPDLSNRVENAVRKALLFRRRGHMWRELPADTRWYEVQLEPNDLPRIRVFPRAHWRKFSNGTFRLDSVVDHIRKLPERAKSDAVIAKIQLLCYRLQREKLDTPVLFIGLDEHGPLTILEGNHRIAAAYLLHPERVPEMYRVICGFSPHMNESCWYQTNAANLWRYLRNRVRNLYDREADLAAVIRDMHSAQNPAATLTAAAAVTHLKTK
jgi:hypothetical protein